MSAQVEFAAPVHAVSRIHCRAAPVTSGSCRRPSRDCIVAAGHAGLGPGSQPARPAHARRGGVGVVAELLGHPGGAAAHAEPPDGAVDCLGHRFGGRRVRWLQPGGEQRKAPGGPRTRRPSARRGSPRCGSRNGPAAACRSCLPARLGACQRPAGLESSHSLSSRGVRFCPARYEATPGRASPEGARRVEPSVAASGTKVPAAGVDRAWPRRAVPQVVVAPRGACILVPVSRRQGAPVPDRARVRPGATMGLSPHDGWLEAASAQVTGD